MKIDIVPQGPVEWFLVRGNHVPVPLMHTMNGLFLVRSVMAGAKLGLFGQLADEARTARDVAEACGTNPRATEKLLNALVGAGYVTLDGNRYALTPMARRWVLPDAPQSLHDNLLFRYAEWNMLERFEDFIIHGEALDIHAVTDGSFSWELYQRGMRSLASLSAAAVAQQMLVPPGATRMLDIGGSHGLYSVELCRRYPALSSEILDLPQAIKHSAPLLAAEGMGDRVVHRAGDALTDDLGTETYDLVFTSQLVHHFDDATNRALARRVAQALRPGGAYVILDALRPENPHEAGQLATFLDLYFAMTSEAGTWSIEEIQAWQHDAGLTVQPTILPRGLPGSGLISGMKPT